MSRIFIFAFCLVFPFLAAAQSGDQVVDFGGDDPTMNAAMADAMSTFPLFLANAVDTQGAGLPGTSVKVSFEVDGGTEVIWVGPFITQGGGQMAGLLANQPNFMPGLNAGDPVQFSQDMVRDWAIQLPDGKLWGHYTTRVVVTQLPAAQAEQIKAVLSQTPVPANWN